MSLLGTPTSILNVLFAGSIKLPVCLTFVVSVLFKIGKLISTSFPSVILVIYVSGISASIYILARFTIRKTSEPGPGATTVPWSLITLSITPAKGALMVDLSSTFLSCAS